MTLNEATVSLDVGHLFQLKCSAYILNTESEGHM